jgi:ABC-type glycerol-3-phosphate transport system permease component
VAPAAAAGGAAGRVLGAVPGPVRLADLGSLRPRAYVFDTSPLPVPFEPQNYVTVWQRAEVLTWLMNSLVIRVMAALAVTLSSAFVAFGFAYFRVWNWLA